MMIESRGFPAAPNPNFMQAAVYFLPFFLLTEYDAKSI